jgi:hypothetical protein
MELFDLNNVTNMIKISHSNMTHCEYSVVSDNVATLKLMEKTSKSQLLKQRCNCVIELKLITLINFIVHNYIITKYYSFGLGF